MTENEKRARRGETAVDKWNRAVREAYTETAGADDDDVLEASDEEIERQLLAAGVDLAEEDAKAAETYGAMSKKLEADERRRNAEDEAPKSDVAWAASTEVPASPTVVPLRRSRAVWVAYALVAAATAGGVAYVAGQRSHEPPREEPRHDEPVVHPVEVTPSPPAPTPVSPAPPTPPEDKKRRGP